jgi:hypothetical protein
MLPRSGGMVIEEVDMEEFISHAGIAILASFVTVHLSLWRFHREKLWEKKLAAYTAIIESLHNLKLVNEEWYEACLTRREIPELKGQAYSETYSKAKEEIAKAIDMGEFVVSNEAAKELDIFLKKLDSAGNDTRMYEDYLEGAHMAIVDCLPTIKRLAKEDLQTPFPAALWRQARAKLKTFA